MLQELRGVAAVLVLFCHAHVALRMPHNLGTSYDYSGGFFRAGYSAVDFFFVLSGFLMVSIHRREEGQPACRQQFYSKRFVRIFPPYWAAIAGLSLLFVIMPRLHGNPPEVSARKVFETTLLLPQDGQLWIPPAWSLTSEMFFYLVFGLFFFARRGAFVAFGLIWFAAIVAAMVSEPVRGILCANKWSSVAFSMRNVGFLAGCLAGYLVDRLSPRIKAPLFWAGLLGFAATWVVDLVDAKRTALSVFVCFYAASSTLIVLGSTAVNLGTRRGMVILGDASYSIYITHLTGLAIMFKIASRVHLAERFGLFATATCCILGALAAGVAFHSLIERPLMAKTRRLVRRMTDPEPVLVNRDISLQVR